MNLIHLKKFFEANILLFLKVYCQIQMSSNPVPPNIVPVLQNYPRLSTNATSNLPNYQVANLHTSPTTSTSSQFYENFENSSSFSTVKMLNFLKIIFKV